MRRKRRLTHGAALRDVCVTRSELSAAKVSICYVAVMIWLYRSGLVSLRWLLKYRDADSQERLEAAFGGGTEIWNETSLGRAFKRQPSDRFPNVPRGHVVHLYENPGAWRGHWMISTGADDPGAGAGRAGDALASPAKTLF